MFIFTIIPLKKMLFFHYNYILIKLFKILYYVGIPICDNPGAGR